MGELVGGEDADALVGVAASQVGEGEQLHGKLGGLQVPARVVGVALGEGAALIESFAQGGSGFFRLAEALVDGGHVDACFQNGDAFGFLATGLDVKRVEEREGFVPGSEGVGVAAHFYTAAGEGAVAADEDALAGLESE